MPTFYDNFKNVVDAIVNRTSTPDPREPDTTRARAQSEDPSTKIDRASSTSVLSYPADRSKYYMSFAFEEYRRPSMFEGLSSDGLTDYICLPLPTNLIDASTFNYEPEEGDFLVDVVAQNFNKNADAYKTGKIDSLDTGIKVAGDLLKEAGKAAVGETIRNVKTALSDSRARPQLSRATRGAAQLLGIADNPFMTVQFKGPNFKVHRFSWRFSPKSPEEMATIQKIINTFKKIAHPQILSSTLGGFYKFPHIVRPKINPENSRNNTYRFKPCVVTDIIVNFSPDQRLAFFDDEAPAEITLDIGLMEIELWRNTGTASGDKSFGTSDFNYVQSPPVRNLGNV